MAIDIVEKQCCGCRTCKTICPANAITFSNDLYGFEYPNIDKSACIDCGKCEKVCPVIHVRLSSEHYRCGAAYVIDDETRIAGSSGGLFGIFAKKIIHDGGVVFGAAFNEKLRLKTVGVDSLEALEPLYKSKYLLCDTDDQFIEIHKCLNQGREVLYCSSPCQIAALKLFLGKQYNNLLTVDFVCQGVGSQALFDKSVYYVEQKEGELIDNFIFRYKKPHAASSHYYYLKSSSKHRVGLYLSFPYYNAYCKQLVCRPECYKCKYAVEYRPSDITIGDFHEIGKFDKGIDRFSGISMFVCNSKKGLLFFQALERKLWVRDFLWENLAKYNRFSNQNSGPPRLYKEFMESISANPFEDTVNMYLRPGKDWKRIIYYNLPKFVRNLIKK